MPEINYYDKNRIREEKNLSRLKNSLNKELMNEGVDIAKVGTYAIVQRYLQYAFTLGYEQCMNEWRNEAVKHPLNL